MKKLLYPLAFTLTTFLILYSCSAEEEDTTPPPALVQPQEPEPDPTQYTLTVTAGEGGTVSTEGGTYDEGTDITITATPAEGYEFIGWEGSNSDSNSLTVTLNSNTSLEALFTKFFNISLASTKGGQIISDVLKYVEGSEVLIYGVPDTGFGFAGFDGIVPPNTNSIKFNPLSNPLSFDIYQDAQVKGFFYWMYENKFSASKAISLSSHENVIPTNIFNNLNLICAPGTECPVDAAIFDYNGDGFLDLVHANSDYLLSSEGQRIINKIQFYLGDGEGGLLSDPANTDKFDGLVHSMDGLIGDFNMDGFTDVLFSGTGPDNSSVPCCEYPVLLLNSSSGEFSEIRFEELVGYYHGSASGDIDNDGHPEILLVDLKPSSPSYIIDFDNNEFTVRQFNVPQYYTYDKLNTRIIDLNKDGYTDIILSGGDINQSVFFREEYTGSIILFGSSSGDYNLIKIPGYQDFESALYTFPYDYDNDGDIDLVRSLTNNYTKYAIQVIENQNNLFVDVTDQKIDNNISGNEIFSDFPFDERGAGIGRLFVGDFNNDGITEIIFNEIQKFPEPKNVVWEFKNDIFEIVERID